ncbi:MAG: GreA/GreB family elongation factor [Chloroflexi bacterium]|nr:GreA/GreB family elongation factor [Chloroflexota bacterium]
MTGEHSQDHILVEAISQFLVTVQAESRATHQQELNAFARWFGGTRSLQELRPYDIERYAERLGTSAIDPAGRLAPLKTFLTFARKTGLVEENLASHIRVRKAGGRSREKAAASVAVETVRLTAEGYASIKMELEALRAQRPEIAEELRHAMSDKDFRENAPLDAARHRQGIIEARIRELEAILKRAEVVMGEHVSTSRAGIGSTVVLWDMGDERQVRYTLVHSNEANIGQGKVSVASPLGRALVDRAVGEVVEVQAPAGTMRYRLEAIEGLS